MIVVTNSYNKYSCKLQNNSKDMKGKRLSQHTKWLTLCLAGSVPSGVVKNSNRRDHCTVTFEVQKDIGPSMGMENRKLVW